MRLFGWLLVALVVSGTQAQAAVITRVYNFTASDFVGILFGEAPPIATVSGSFRLTFDPAVIVSDQVVGLEVLSLSLPFSGLVTYSTFPGTLNLAIGIGSSAITRGQDNFALTIDNAGRDFGAAARPLDRFDKFQYTASGTTDLFRANQSTFSLGLQPPVNVPEPATITLLGSGLAGLGWLARRRSAVASGGPAAW